MVLRLILIRWIKGFQQGDSLAKGFVGFADTRWIGGITGPIEAVPAPVNQPDRVFERAALPYIQTLLVLFERGNKILRIKCWSVQAEPILFSDSLVPDAVTFEDCGGDLLGVVGEV